MSGKEKMFCQAFEYYVAGRFSVYARSSLTAGNQFHHAIERLLKGHLLACTKSDKVRKAEESFHNLNDGQDREKAARELSTLQRSDELATLNTLREQFQHRLNDLWDAFKTETGDDSLKDFDETVKRLDEFENLRYPDKVLLKSGATFVFGVEEFASIETDRSERTYYISLVEFDRLVKAICEVASINPEFYMQRMSDLAVEVLKQDNCWLGAQRSNSYKFPAIFWHGLNTGKSTPYCFDS